MNQGQHGGNREKGEPHVGAGHPQDDQAEPGDLRVALLNGTTGPRLHSRNQEVIVCPPAGPKSWIACSGKA